MWVTLSFQGQGIIFSCIIYVTELGLQLLTLGAPAQRGLGVCLSLSVCLSRISPMELLFVLKTLSRTQRATKVKIIICGVLPETAAFKSYAAKHERKSQYANYSGGQLSPFDTQRSARGYPTIVNSIQPCLKRCLLMPRACVERELAATRVYSYNARRGQSPRQRIGIVRAQDMLYLRRRFCTSVLFHLLLTHAKVYLCTISSCRHSRLSCRLGHRPSSPI